METEKSVEQTRPRGVAESRSGVVESRRPRRWDGARTVLRSLRGAPGELPGSDHEYRTVCGHPGARYVLSEAAAVLATGVPDHPARLARAAATWATALESLEKPRQPTAFWVANELELSELAATVRSVERAARHLSGGTPAGAAARSELVEAVRRYAAGIGPFLDQYADVLACRRGAMAATRGIQSDAEGGAAAGT